MLISNFKSFVNIIFFPLSLFFSLTNTHFLNFITFLAGPLSIGGDYQDDVDDMGSEDDENAIIDVEDYKIPANTINTSIPSTQTSSTGLSQSAHQNNNGSTSKNRIGRPTKSSLSSPVSSSTASDDERLSPDSVKVRNYALNKNINHFGLLTE